MRVLTLLNLELGRRCAQPRQARPLAGLDVAEHRRPQDGRWVRQVPGADKIDLRINIMPTLYGEDFTLRLLHGAPSQLAVPG